MHVVGSPCSEEASLLQLTVLTHQTAWLHASPAAAAGPVWRYEEILHA